MSCKEKVKISVLVPTFNMGEFIEEAILSVINGHFDDFEIIIIDDGSEDNTREIVKSFTRESSDNYDSRVKYIYKRNGGKSSALNSVFSIIKGSYVAILDADDKIPPRGLVDRYEAAETSCDTPQDLVVGGYEVFSDKGVVGRREAPEENDPANIKYKFCFGYKTPIYLNSCLISRDLLMQVGPFDESLRRAQDQDYVLRMIKNTRNIGYISSYVYRHRKHRDKYIERIKYRGKNLIYRPQMLKKHTGIFEGALSIVVSSLFDIAKMIYEIRGEYYSRNILSS